LFNNLDYCKKLQVNTISYVGKRLLFVPVSLFCAAKPRKNIQMQRFSYHSAQVSCEQLPTGAFEVVFYGLLTKKGFAVLRDHACRFAQGAPSIVMRMDLALLADAEDFMSAAPRLCPHDAVALVVPAERYEQALALASRMATAFGVRRPVFLPDQAPLAYQWASHVARSQCAR
jgi:hypothetical protein